MSKYPTSTQKTSDWHPADVLSALRRKGFSLRQLAISHGYGPRSLNMVLRNPWLRGEQIIAHVLELTPQDIWPSRFLEDGCRLDRRKVARCPQCGYIHKTRSPRDVKNMTTPKP